jgi:hypothetical protein
VSVSSILPIRLPTCAERPFRNVTHRHEPPVTSDPIRVLHRNDAREFVVVDKPGSIVRSSLLPALRLLPDSTLAVARSRCTRPAATSRTAWSRSSSTTSGCTSTVRALAPAPVAAHALTFARSGEPARPAHIWASHPPDVRTRRARADRRVHARRCAQGVRRALHGRVPCVRAPYRLRSRRTCGLIAAQGGGRMRAAAPDC